RPATVGNYRLVERVVRPAARAAEGPSTPGAIQGHAPPVPDVAMIRVGVALTLLEQDMAKIDRLVLLLVGLVLVLAPLVGYVLAGRVAGWIGTIIQTASRLRPDYLDERLPMRGTGDELDQLAATVNGLLDRIAEALRRK